MKADELGRSRLLNLLFKPAGWAMESRPRGWFWNPDAMLRAAGLRAGETVLEVGAGTGFFTLDAARLLGEDGRLIAVEPLADYARRLRDRARIAGYGNVEVLRRDALETGLADGSVDLALLFGVLPFPTLPLNRLLPEMHRVLRQDGRIALWMFPVDGWTPGAIARSGLFRPTGKRDGIFTYRRVDAAA